MHQIVSRLNFYSPNQAVVLIKIIGFFVLDTRENMERKLKDITLYAKKLVKALIMRIPSSARNNWWGVSQGCIVALTWF